MRKKSGVKNVLFGLINFGIITALGIIIPRLFLTTYGSEVNGLVNSIKQIFSYFALLEAGIGGATTQALYSPVAKQEYQKVSAILSASNKFYRRTGIIYGFAVAIMAIIYPLSVKTDINRYIIVGIILFTGGIGVIRYLVTAKLQLLLEVDGKNYIVSNVNTIFTIASDFSRIVLIYLGANVLWVQGMYFLVSIGQSIILVTYVKKHYGWLELKEKPDYQSVSQRNSVILHQVSGLIFNNTDTVILTFFCGLKVVSVYAMYAMLYNIIANIISTISSGLSFARGQIFHTDIKRFEKIQDTYETYFLAFCFALFTIGYIFMLPFLRLYTHGVTDINYIDIRLPVLFTVIQILNYGRSTSNNIIGYAGHFKQTQWRAILEAGINLSVSLVGVYFLGIYGVLLGTIAALLYRTNDMILYTNLKIMNRSAWPTYRRWLRNIVLLIATAYAGSFLPQSYSGYLPLIGCACVVSVIVLLVFFGLNSLFEKSARQTMWAYAKPMIRKITKKIKL